VLECPANNYAQGRLCSTSCTSPLFADPISHLCVSSCFDSFALTSGVNACVSGATCALYSKIADNTSNTCTPLCPSDPDLYNQNGYCVSKCTGNNIFADPTANVRACTGLCTTGLFGDPVSGRCIPKCQLGYYAVNGTNICTQLCPTGYADNVTSKCVLTCPAPTYGDSQNNRCMKVCSNGQFAQGRICTGTCLDPDYGNPATMLC